VDGTDYYIHAGSVGVDPTHTDLRAPGLGERPTPCALHASASDGAYHKV